MGRSHRTSVGSLSTTRKPARTLRRRRLLVERDAGIMADSEVGVHPPQRHHLHPLSGPDAASVQAHHVDTARRDGQQPARFQPASAGWGGRGTWSDASGRRGRIGKRGQQIDSTAGGRGAQATTGAARQSPALTIPCKAQVFDNLEKDEGPVQWTGPSPRASQLPKAPKGSRPPP